jgi:hypothetical protein
MKKLLVIFFGYLMFFSCNILIAQEQVNAEDESDPLRFYKAKYDATYDAPIEIVAKATIKSLDDIACLIVQKKEKTDDEDGFIRWVIKSDYCVFVEGDSSFVKLREKSKQMPFIRGGAWKTGRIQYKFVITEQADGKVYLLLNTSLSGFEYYVTNKVHFWESNGQFEHEIMTAIEKNIELLKQELPKKE